LLEDHISVKIDLGNLQDQKVLSMYTTPVTGPSISTDWVITFLATPAQKKCIHFGTVP
jgi:hypothetical protein